MDLSVKEACGVIEKLLENAVFIIEGLQSQLDAETNKKSQTRSGSLPNAIKRRSKKNIFTTSGSYLTKYKSLQDIKEKKKQKRLQLLRNQMQIELLKQCALTKTLSVYQELDQTMRIPIDDVLKYIEESEESAKAINSLSKQNQKIQQEIKSLEEEKQKLTKKEKKKKGTAQKLHEQSLEMKTRLQGYNDIEISIRNLKTKEGYNIQKFILDYLHEESKEPEIVWNFVDAISTSLQTKLDISEYDKCRSCVENFIFPVLYSKMMDELHLEEADAKLLETCKTFATSTQDQFNICKELQDTRLIPYYEAIAILKTIYFQPTPSKKLMVLLEAASAIYKNAEIIAPDRKVGGDDFIDIWVYVILQAQIRNLASTVEYIGLYTPEDMIGETGYYYSCLDVAKGFIERLDHETLKSMAPSTISVQRPIIVCERERMKKFCTLDSHIDLKCETVELIGFKLFLVKDWFLAGNKFFSSFLIETKDSLDKVIVSIIQPNESVTGMQEKFLIETFFSDNIDEGFQVSQHHLGTIPATKSKKELENCYENPNYIYIPSGDFDKNQDLLAMYSTLCFLNIPASLSAPYISETDLDNLSKIIRIPSDEIKLPDDIILFTKKIQNYLKILAWALPISKIDGILSMYYQNAIYKFHNEYNDACSRRRDGLMHPKESALWWENEENELFELEPNSFDTRTIICLEKRISNLMEALSSLGYPVEFSLHDDDIYERMEEVVKLFQKKLNLFEIGNFEVQTKKALLDEILK